LSGADFAAIFAFGFEFEDVDFLSSPLLEDFTGYGRAGDVRLADITISV